MKRNGLFCLVMSTGVACMLFGWVVGSNYPNALVSVATAQSASEMLPALNRKAADRELTKFLAALPPKEALELWGLTAAKGAGEACEKRSLRDLAKNVRMLGADDRLPLLQTHMLDEVARRLEWWSYHSKGYDIIQQKLKDQFKKKPPGDPET